MGCMVAYIDVGSGACLHCALSGETALNDLKCDTTKA